jgi:hypothetical protein
MKEINKQLLKEMNGIEIESLKYESVIGIEGNKVIREGKVLDYLNTEEKIKTLWNELMEQEGIDLELKEVLRE